MKISITQATTGDAATIFELQKLAYKNEAELYNDFDIPPLTQTLDEMKSDFENKIFLKADVEGKIVGAVKAHQLNRVCFIERLIVHPSFQGRGIGTLLMSRIEAHFEQAQRFELFTVHKSERNIGLYQRLGYLMFKTEKISENLSFVFMEKRQ